MFNEPYLAPCATNHEALTRLAYPEFGQLVRRMAHGLCGPGVGKGDVLSLILPNRPELLAPDPFCRASLAGFRRPKKFIPGALARTVTGKVQKFAWRQKAKEMTDEQ
ncbi:hypothetical protein [Paracoccus sp. M683]|uniref:hypothetical protein n=1 Tax=Paracoccus sp. M683 TaxID=2594268 RepID=UPI00163DE223|nr:hypothetical protein [Paracoccus sp. M683]